LGLWAWRSKNRILKWGGAGLAGVLTLLVAALIVLMGAGLIKLRSRVAAVPELTVAGTASQVHRGKEIADGFCGACHSKTGTLTGGMDVGKDFPIPIGSFVSSNLTPVGQLSHWSDGEIFRAIRNAVDAKGNRLVVMSLTNAGKLSDDDIQSLIAYIRSRPPSGEKTPEPPDQLSALGLIMLGAGMLPDGKPVMSGVINAPAKSASPQYGEYILSYQDCRECHGSKLTGGVQGQLPPIGPGMGIMKDWTLEGFISTMRTGIDPAGHHLGKAMPWEPIGKMDDEELAAMYEYLVSLPN
jgi:cytochrome c553